MVFGWVLLKTLLELEANRFSTMSLAGTQKEKLDVKPKWTPKEIKEQSIEFIGSQLNNLHQL